MPPPPVQVGRELSEVKPIDEIMKTEQFIIVAMKVLVGDIIDCVISQHYYFSDTCKMRLHAAAQTLST